MNDAIRTILDRGRENGWVMEPDAKAILKAYDLPVTRHGFARTLEEAREAAESLGWPVVAKIVSPKIVHKSDAGGVVAGIRDETALREAFERLSAIEGFQGVLLDETASGVELFLGARQDPQFGTVVLAGIGGTAVEVYKDVAIRMAPLDEADALEALSALQGRALLEGFRGSPPVDRQAVAHLLASFSEAAHDLRDDVESVDLNPVFASPKGALIADARLMLFQP